MSVFLRRALLVLGATLGLLLVVFFTLVNLGISVDLSPFREPFVRLATESLDRRVEVKGAMTLVPTFSPTVEIQGLSIENPPGWSTPHFARMDLARLELAVLPLLLHGRLQVREIRAEGVEILLERNRSGVVTWSFGAPEAAEAQAPPPEDEGPSWLDELLATEDEDQLVTGIELEQLVLEKVAVTYRNHAGEEPVVFVIDELSGRAATDKPLRFDASGTYRGHPYTFMMSSGRLVDFWTGEENWPVEFGLDIAGTSLKVSAILDEGEADLGELLDIVLDARVTEDIRRFAVLDISVSGDRLDSLDSLLGVSLPPVGPHRFEGRFSGFMNGRFTSKVEVGVGSNTLAGTMELELATEPPRARIDLATERIQLAEIDLGGWSPLEPAPAPEVQDGTQSEEELSAPLAAQALLSPEVLGRQDLELAISVGEVLSGDDRLGTAELLAQLDGGRFGLERFDLEVPGGAVQINAALEPGASGVVAALDLDIETFDYGILARRADPATEMDGVFGVDVDLESASPDLAGLLAHATGRVDVAVFPEEFESGIFDFWAVNLMTMALPELDSEASSKLNCVVGFFDLTDGKLQEREILIDTSKMSVVGTAAVDFETQSVEVELVPTAKKPEFFSLATPVHVEGTIPDFTVGVRAQDVMGTLIQFTTSIIHVPIRRLFGKKISEDGAEACMGAIDRRPEARATP